MRQCHIDDDLPVGLPTLPRRIYMVSRIWYPVVYLVLARAEPVADQ